MEEIFSLTQSSQYQFTWECWPDILNNKYILAAQVLNTNNSPHPGPCTSVHCTAQHGDVWIVWFPDELNKLSDAALEFSNFDINVHGFG